MSQDTQLNAKLTHLIRVGLVVALLWAIPSPSRAIQVDAGTPPSVEAVRLHVPSAESIVAAADANGLWAVHDSEGETIATVARTLPMAADVVGYRGPTQSLIVLDEKLQIQAVSLLGSRDTEEHVDAVVANEAFFEQFAGWPWGGPGDGIEVDAVSGATLTSLALAEGVLKRIGGERPSLIFPNDLTVDEIAAAELDQLIRTGPLTDDIAGYQGPTELLLTIDPDSTLKRVRLRSSYDNEPYVDYVRTERRFWARFEGKTIAQLAAFDPQAAGIEGVSGATMTSLAVADTIVAAAQASQVEPVGVTSQSSMNPRWTIADIMTLAILGLLFILHRTGQLRSGIRRRAWLLLVVATIGFWAGNLISLALIAGWSAAGIAWRLAPGLSIMAAVTLLVPPLTKGNPYCNHLCPHGAIQQLVMPKSKLKSKSRRIWKLPPRLTTLLSWIPGVTLVAAYVMLIMIPTTDLSSWEPFHAYLFRIATWASFALAGGSLLIAGFIPMAYCRFGCPTGRLLDYVRRSAQSGRITRADAVAVGLLVFAFICR